MQASKSSRRASPESPHRRSPAAAKSNRSSKAAGVEVDSTAGINQLRKIPSHRSQKENEQQSLCRNPVLEKKRPSHVTYLESQLGELQEELKKTKDQLASSESCRKRIQQEAEEAKMQLMMMSSKFEDSQLQLMMLSAAEDDRIHQLRKISLERDRAWQSELTTLQNQQSIDMAAWSSATKEIQKLKSEIEMLVKAEAAQAKQLETTNLELQALREEMVKKDSIIESLKFQIAESKGAEAKAEGRANESQLQLETAEANIDILRCDVLKLMESFNSIASDLEKSKARVNELEDMVKKPQSDQLASFDQVGGTGHVSLESDVEQITSLLESMDNKYQKELVKKKLQTQSVYELVDKMKITFSQRECELESELKEAAADIAELKSKLLNKDMDLRSISDMNKKLNDEIRAQVNQVEAEFSSKISQAAIDITDLKVRLLDKDVALRKYLEENKLLKIEIGNKEIESIKICEVEITKAKAEMEAKLRRVNVHSEQWRKAAETAAAILMTGNDGRDIQRTGSLDPQCFCDGRGLMQSPCLDEMGGHSPRSKNYNVLRMIGGLWKKV